MIPEYILAGGEGTLFWGGTKQPEIPLPDKDGRDYAMNALIAYISNLTFSMTGNNNVISFQIPSNNIYKEWPDNESLLDRGDDDFPRIGFEITDEMDDYHGLVPTAIDGSDDLYGPDTILYSTSEHNETLNLHCMTRSIAERRAIISGLEAAFNPSQDFTGLRFRLPFYFNSPCRFTLESGGRHDDPDAVRNRRSAMYSIKMRLPNVFLVTAYTFIPQVAVDMEPQGKDLTNITTTFIGPR